MDIVAEYKQREEGERERSTKSLHTEVTAEKKKKSFVTGTMSRPGTHTLSAIFLSPADSLSPQGGGWSPGYRNCTALGLQENNTNILTTQSEKKMNSLVLLGKVYVFSLS